MITSSQVFDICKFDLMRSYVNVQHRYYKRGLGAPMGGLISALYAMLVCSRREAMVVKPRLTELALPMVTCRYIDDVLLAFAWQDNKQLERATEIAKYIAAEGTGYPHPLVRDFEPERIQRFLELTVAPVGKHIVFSFYTKVAQNWKQDGSCIQMRLPDPHSAVTSQQQLGRVTGTVQRMMKVELEPTGMWLAPCELDIECYVSSYNASYIA